MIDKNKTMLRDVSPYNGSLTREQFLFYEMRTVARLVKQGLKDEEIIEKVYSENLFQYPTERMLKNLTRVCLKRLHAMNDEKLINEIVNQPSNVSKQICLYAMMKQYHLVWDFMVTVIGEKYRLRDASFGKINLNIFFMRLQEQDDWVATWSDSTIKKLKQVLTKMLVENEYLDSTKAEGLNSVWLNPVLENAIRSNGDEQALPAFNCFS